MKPDHKRFKAFWIDRRFFDAILLAYLQENNLTAVFCHHEELTWHKEHKIILPSKLELG